MGSPRIAHKTAQNHFIAGILIDVISDLEFSGGEELLQSALPAAKNIARLKERARQANVPVIYANDNFGRWRSDLTGSSSIVCETMSGDDQLRNVFVSYNKTKGKKFEILGRFGPERARALIDSAVTNFNQSRRTANRSAKKTKR